MRPRRLCRERRWPPRHALPRVRQNRQRRNPDWRLAVGFAPAGRVGATGQDRAAHRGPISPIGLARPVGQHPGLAVRWQHHRQGGCGHPVHRVGVSGQVRQRACSCAGGACACRASVPWRWCCWAWAGACATGGRLTRRCCRAGRWRCCTLRCSWRSAFTACWRWGRCLRPWWWWPHWPQRWRCCKTRGRLAVIGALGGFATPLLVSTGSGNHVALFSYYLVLDLGIAAVAWHKTWRPLNLIGFVGTFVVGAAWGVTRYTDPHYLSSQGFLIAFFLLFNAILLMPARRLQATEGGGSQRTDGWVNGSLLFGLPAITFALQHGMLRNTEYGTALSALALAAFYVLMAGVDAQARQPGRYLRCQPGPGHRVSHARDPVCARCSQHCRRLGTGRRGHGVVGLSPGARAASLLRLRAVVVEWRGHAMGLRTPR